MSYFNVFFQATICHSWFPAAKLRPKKRSYGNNCDRWILKKHKKSVGERIFSICSWVSPEYFLIRLMSTPSASMFLAISKAFSFLPSCFAVSIEFLISRYAILLASYVLWIQIRHVLHNLSAIKKAVEEANQ